MDILGAAFQAIGAEVDASQKCVQRGCVPVGAPLARRIPLALVSLRAACLPVTSDVLLARLGGAWVSAALFRRCSMFLFSKVFERSPGFAGGAVQQRALPLKRACAQELVLASVLTPVLASNITAGHSTEIYVTDASLGKGAICSTSVDRETSRSLWA